jgi:YidC/Oxa1 family membrane protein insertase
MKLNRTEWLVVILCSVALAWMITRPKPKTETKPDQKPAATAAAAAAGTETNAATPAPAAAPVVPETTVIKNETAEYTFTNIGGGLQSMKILKGKFSGETEQVLNGNGYRGAIGALSRAAGDIENLPYTVEEKTDRSITYTAVANGMKITKLWEMAKPKDDGKEEDGWGYLWNLSVTFTNTTDIVQAGPYYLYTGLVTRLHDNDWIMPAATWYADGDAEEMDYNKFDRSTFLGLWETTPKRQEIKKDLVEMVFGGVHNQYYAVLLSPAGEVKEESSTPVWMQRQWVTFDDPGRGKVTGHGMEAGVGLDSFTLTKDQSHTWKGQLYTGPRSGSALNKIEGERRQAMHYGWFRTLSRLFLGLLNTFHNWVTNYGVAIMMLTLLVRICIWPLHIKATRAMKRMSKLAPMMKDIREKHKEDPQRMNVEVMKLYREYGVNPLGGCLPLLFQFPIFLGYYNMMKSAVEMRGHSFLWVQDLSMPDTVAHVMGIPINPLPILMTITMFIQMKVSPQPTMADNPQMQMQMKIFKVMPFLFMFFCYNFASALALYWTVQNIISIGQTWLMKLQPEPELVKVPPRPSFMERAMAAQQARQQQMKKGGPKPPRTGGGSGSAFRDQQRKK